MNLNHPSYYDTLYSANHADELADIKTARRVAAEAAVNFKLKNDSTLHKYLNLSDGTSESFTLSDDERYLNILKIEEMDLLSRLGFILERTCEDET